MRIVVLEGGKVRGVSGDTCNTRCKMQDVIQDARCNTRCKM